MQPYPTGGRAPISGGYRRILFAAKMQLYAITRLSQIITRVIIESVPNRWPVKLSNTACYISFKVISLCHQNLRIILQEEAQLPQRNSASATLVFLGWLTDRAVHCTVQLLYYYHRPAAAKVVSTLSAKKASNIRDRQPDSSQAQPVWNTCSNRDPDIANFEKFECYWNVECTNNSIGIVSATRVGPGRNSVFNKLTFAFGEYFFFLPRDALVHSAVMRLLSSVCPSVRLSVCL